MTKNINFNADDDDTEGHRVLRHEESNPVAPESSPSDQDDDDTEGHRFLGDEAPQIAGGRLTDPKA